MPTLNQNQFGINIGGPLKRDQTFFFFSYEGQRSEGADADVLGADRALRAGDFSGLQRRSAIR